MSCSSSSGGENCATQNKSCENCKITSSMLRGFFSLTLCLMRISSSGKLWNRFGFASDGNFFLKNILICGNFANKINDAEIFDMLANIFLAKLWFPKPDTCEGALKFYIKFGSDFNFVKFLKGFEANPLIKSRLFNMEHEMEKYTRKDPTAGFFLCRSQSFNDFDIPWSRSKKQIFLDLTILHLVFVSGVRVEHWDWDSE